LESVREIAPTHMPCPAYKHQRQEVTDMLAPIFYRLVKNMECVRFKLLEDDLPYLKGHTAGGGEFH
jgi:hypothetical protein